MNSDNDPTIKISIVDVLPSENKDNKQEIVVTEVVPFNYEQTTTTIVNS